MVGARMDPEAISKCESGSDTFLFIRLERLYILHRTMEPNQRTDLAIGKTR